MMSQDVKVIYTGDLALATTLRMEGYEPLRLEMNGDKAARWVYLDVSTVRAIIAEYTEREVRVEPRGYNKVLSKTRRELFRFLTANGVTPTPSER